MGYKAFFEKKNSLGITPKDYGQGLHWFTINLAGINFLTIETICSKYFPRKQKDGIDVVLVGNCPLNLKILKNKSLNLCFQRIRV